MEGYCDNPLTRYTNPCIFQHQIVDQHGAAGVIAYAVLVLVILGVVALVASLSRR